VRQSDSTSSSLYNQNDETLSRNSLRYLRNSLRYLSKANLPIAVNEQLEGTFTLMCGEGSMLWGMRILVHQVIGLSG